MEQSIEDKSFQFAVRIVKLCRYLEETKKEYVLSKQIMRSGTAIGANVAESQQAQSRADFISKMSIALKEAVETNYWLRLLQETNYIKCRISIPFQGLQRIGDNSHCDYQNHKTKRMSVASLSKKCHEVTP